MASLRKLLLTIEAPEALNPDESGEGPTGLWRPGESLCPLVAAESPSEEACCARRAGEDGGEDGIRTHEKLLTSTPLAGERLRPLGHLSVAPLDKEKRGHNQQAGAIIAEKSSGRQLRKGL
ncbi:hypothetical protein MPLSOD_40881 [Mesorhizobium sp. SOD10]|nr:hypothetical protein MPLSOD_40881 [Mesorhizobium sp. SOD10]